MGIKAISIKSIKPLHDGVLVTEMNFNERRTTSGVIVLSDDGRDQGIRPRWGRVYAIGPEQKEIKIGQWICVAHGRWTRGTKIEIDGSELTVRKVDNKDILLVSDEPIVDDTIGAL